MYQSGSVGSQVVQVPFFSRYWFSPSSSRASAAPLPAARIAIVDDVVTTGSTASEIARVLKRGGATWVEVWAVARAARG